MSKPGRGRLPGRAEGSGLFGAFTSSAGRARVAHANGEQGRLRTLTEEHGKFHHEKEQTLFSPFAATYILGPRWGWGPGAP